MPDLVGNLGLGFAIALTLHNVALCFLGCLIGTLIGVLPGVGPIATIAMLLPLTFKVDPTGALIMLAGIYYGAQYGGSTTAILINMPGEATSVVTTLDGHAMARTGRAGVALGIAAIASFFAGTVATLVIAALGAPLTRLALLFGPGRVFRADGAWSRLAVVLARGSVLKAMVMVVFGLLLATVGTDLETGEDRLTLGCPISPTASISRCWRWACSASPRSCAISRIRKRATVAKRHRPAAAVARRPAAQFRADRARHRARLDARHPAGQRRRARAVRVLYAGEEDRRDPSRFGRGAIEGVAGPEAANNAGAQTAFIPLLTLGIPPNAVMALMVGAMTIHGIIPGPQVMTKNPDLFWGMIASMWIGNLMLLIINLPLVGLWVRLLKVPYRLMFPAILLFCCIGIYSINNNPSDVFLTAFFGLVGYVFIKLGLEPAPMLLGFVLGRLMEEKLRQALALSEGSFMTFAERPVSAALLLLARGMRDRGAAGDPPEAGGGLSASQRRKHAIQE